MTLFAWDGEKGSWETKPIAVSDRGVWGKGQLWQHSLALVADRDSERAKEWKRSKASLPEGGYLLKVHVDVNERLKWDWEASLGDADLAGEAIIESKWPAGYGKMTVIEAADLRQPVKRGG